MIWFNRVWWVCWLVVTVVSAVTLDLMVTIALCLIASRALFQDMKEFEKHLTALNQTNYPTNYDYDYPEEKPKRRTMWG